MSRIQQSTAPELLSQKNVRYATSPLRIFVPPVKPLQSIFQHFAYNYERNYHA